MFVLHLKCCPPPRPRPRPAWVQVFWDWSVPLHSEQGGWGQWRGGAGWVGAVICLALLGPHRLPDPLKTQWDGREDEHRESESSGDAAPSLPSLGLAISSFLRVFPLLSAEMPLCSLVCSVSGGRRHSFSASALAHVGALDYPVEMQSFLQMRDWGLETFHRIDGSLAFLRQHWGLRSIF